MTSLQKIGMGLVIVLVDASFSGYDAVPDPIGWLLVVVGLLASRPVLPGSDALVVVAGLCLVVSVVVYPPTVAERVDPSAGWALSLPQLAFSFMLCVALAALVERLAGRLLVLRWAFVLGALGPILVFGGGLRGLIVPLAVLVVAAGIYLVFLVFRASSILSASR